MSSSNSQVVTVLAEDLPIHCPNNQMPVWSTHPKVYLTPDSHGAAACPYCGTKYQVDGPVKGH